MNNAFLTSLYEENDVLAVNGKKVSDIWMYDEDKVSTAKLHGFEVLIIWESDWKYYKDECLKKAKDFIFFGLNAQQT